MAEVQFKDQEPATKNPWWLSLWGWWAALSILFLFTETSSLADGLTGRVIGFVGLLVPITSDTLYLIYSDFVHQFYSDQVHLSLLAPLMVLAAIFLGERLNRQLHRGPIVRIFCNLAILFVLTVAVNLYIKGEWIPGYLKILLKDASPVLY